MLCPLPRSHDLGNRSPRWGWSLPGCGACMPSWGLARTGHWRRSAAAWCSTSPDPSARCTSTTGCVLSGAGPHGPDRGRAAGSLCLGQRLGSRHSRAIGRVANLLSPACVTARVLCQAFERFEYLQRAQQEPQQILGQVRQTPRLCWLGSGGGHPLTASRHRFLWKLRDGDGPSRVSRCSARMPRRLTGATAPPARRAGRYDRPQAGLLHCQRE